MTDTERGKKSLSLTCVSLHDIVYSGGSAEKYFGVCLGHITTRCRIVFFLGETRHSQHTSSVAAGQQAGDTQA